MPAKQADFNFVGDAYSAADPYQDRQELINWFVEISQSEGSKTPRALLGCPGLVLVASVLGL